MKTGRAQYSVHPGVVMAQKSIASLPEKTGRSLDEWLALVEKKGPASEAERAAWLKAGHGLGTNWAGWVAARSVGKGLEDSDPDAYLAAAEAYVENMYAGAKAGLLPIHERLLELGLSIGPDAKACPCSTIVPLYRNHVFAQIKPSTRTRIDLGLALAACSKKIPTFIIDTGGAAKKDRITHRIPIASLDDINADVERWLGIAYKLDAK